MELFAHRGFAGLHAENTVGAVAAAAQRADAVEVDVRRCGSGELVVVHDETVDRVTDGHGPVADHTAAELAALDVLGSGEGVPTLDDLLAAVPPAVAVNVELKEYGLATDALAAAAEVENEVLVSSFRPAALAACRRTDPDAALALLFHEAPGDKLALARELDCAAVHPRRALAEAVVEPAHAAGMSVNVWTLTERAEAEAMADLGVDGVIADAPDVWEVDRA
jgi:glycerophosphoryl diester phosphodiesterase